MSGKVLGGSPWMRTAIRDFAGRYPDTLAAVEEAIPAGHHISLTCGGRPRPLGAILVDDANQREVCRVEPAYHSVGSAAYAVLNAGKVVAA